MIKLRNFNSIKLLENDFDNTLKLLSPGTSLREGIDCPYRVHIENIGAIGKHEENSNTSAVKQEKFQFSLNSNRIFLIGSILLVIFLIGCGGKLGTVKIDDVQSVIAQAEKAINDAREVKSDSLAFEQFERAETELEKAKDALKNEDGVVALKSANLAYSYAKMAKYEAIQNSNNAVTNANILAKEAKIGELERNLENQNSKIIDLERGLQRLEDTERNLNNTITTLNNEKQEIVRKNRINIDKLSEVNEELNTLKNRITRSETEVRNYGNEVKDLTRKLDASGCNC